MFDLHVSWLNSNMLIWFKNQILFLLANSCSLPDGIIVGDFMPDLHFPRLGALKFWHVIPTGAFIIIRGITFKEKEI
jgi:hypothetical protein